MPALVAVTHRGDASIIDRLECAWRRFTLDTPNTWAMYTPTWLRTWYAAFGRDRPLVIVTVSEGDHLVAVAPFLEDRRGPVRIWRCPANIYSDKSDIAVRPHDRDRILDVLWQEIERQRWSVIDWRLAPANGNVAALVARRRHHGQPGYSRQTHRTPVVPLGPAVDPAQIGPRKNLRRSRRLLANHGSLAEVFTSPATAANLDTFFRLEAAGWKGRSGTDAGNDPESAAFYRNIILAPPQPDFVVVCHEIKLDGTTIAIDIGVRSGQRHFALKGSYDETWRAYGPGQLCASFIIRETHAAGYPAFDFLGTDDAYKLRWTDITEPVDHHIILRANLVGRVLQLAIVHSVPIVKRARTIDIRGKPKRLVETLRQRLARQAVSRA